MPMFVAMITALLALASSTAALRLMQAVVMPGTNGPSKFNQFGFDAPSGLLFCTLKYNNSVQLFNTTSMTLSPSLTAEDFEFDGPQGATATASLLFVGDAKDGLVHVLNFPSFVPQFLLNLTEDADDQRLDARFNLVWIGAGGDNTPGFVYALDGTTGRIRGRAPTDGHPEAMQLSESTDLLLVCMPHVKSSIAIVSRSNFSRLATFYLSTVTNVTKNYAMAWDQAAGLLYLGCRTPPAIVVLDSTSWTLHSTSLAAPPGIDDIWLDTGRGVLYATGDGALYVYNATTLDVLQVLPTGADGVDSCLDPISGNLFVGVPSYKQRNGSSTLLIFSP